MNVESLPEELVPFVISAMEQKALFHRVNGQLYASTCTTNGHWVWKLGERTEHFVSGDACSCGAVGCDHVYAIRYGSGWRAA